LDFTAFKKQPKWIVGFSDVTVLHNHLNTLGFKSIHGIMPITAPRATTQAIETLQWHCLEKNFPTLFLLGKNKTGKASGELVGGNLSILYSLFGSPSAIDCSDKILFMKIMT
jgi:muramoyltetrapeptide carboxypeptidase